MTNAVAWCSWKDSPLTRIGCDVIVTRTCQEIPTPKIACVLSMAYRSLELRFGQTMASLSLNSSDLTSIAQSSYLSSDPGRNSKLSETTTDDVQNLEQIILRDMKALASLYERYAGMVMAVCHSVLNESDAAEAVLIDLFLDVWNNPGNFVSERALSRRLATEAMRRSVTRYRELNGNSATREMIIAMIKSGNLRARLEVQPLGSI